MDGPPEQAPGNLIVHWQVKTPRIYLGHDHRVLLLVEALHHDVAICHFRVVCTDLDGQPGPSLVLGHTGAVYGVRRWKVETATPGKNFVRACGNFKFRPEAVVKVLGAQVTAGNDLWQFSGHMQELVLARGQAMALCGRALEPCRVQVEMAGI